MMTTKIPPILEAVKDLVLTWASKVTDPFEVLRKPGKIPESTITRMLNPNEVPTDKTFLGFNAFHFETAAGVSIYGYVITEAKKGLWGDVDHLPDIRTHEDLVNALAASYKGKEEERFKLLSNRAYFDSNRDIKNTLDGRPFFWKRIPGTLEFIAFYTKGVTPKGPPQGDLAFDVKSNTQKQSAPKVSAGVDEVKTACLEPKTTDLTIDGTGVGFALNMLVAYSELVCRLGIDPKDVTQIQRSSVVRALIRTAQSFGVTPESLEANRSDSSHGGAALAVLTQALNHQRRR